MGYRRKLIWAIFLVSLIFLSIRHTFRSTLSFINSHPTFSTLEQTIRKKSSAGISSVPKSIFTANLCSILKHYPFVQSCTSKFHFIPPGIEYMVEFEEPRFGVVINDSRYLVDSIGRMLEVDQDKLRFNKTLIYLSDQALATNLLPQALRLVLDLSEAGKNVCSSLLSNTAARFNICGDLTISFYYFDYIEFRQLSYLFHRKILSKINKFKNVKEITVNLDKSMIISLKTL